MVSIPLTPGRVSINDLASLWQGERSHHTDPAMRPAVEAAAAVIQRAAAGTEPVYGVNTGFGKLASIKVDPEDTAQLQKNLILSHCCGVGDPMPLRVVRLMMVLKALSLGRGASGVRWEVIALLDAMIAHSIFPIVPAQGSVGASGDLAPLAHMAAAMMGHGAVWTTDGEMPADQALRKHRLTPIVLGAKEGLALINGTQYSLAYALAGLFGAWCAAQNALVISAMSTDAIMGSTAPLHPEIHTLRGHAGQIEAAAAMRALLDGSVIRESHRAGDTRVQDPYCIRCQPQVTGAAIDVLRMACHTLVTEANAVTDNPLVLSDGQIVSGGNFHAEPIGFAVDMIAMAISEIGAIAQRRVALMVDPTLSFDLPAFLTPRPGLNSGLMIAEVTTAALMSENKHAAHPTVIDSTPTSANQEDHVSMAAHGARRLGKMVENLNVILGVEAICAAQGIGFRSPLTTSAPLSRVIARLRQDIEPLGDDRYLAPDLAAAAALVASGALTDAAAIPLPAL